jgi:hypothetical protein
MKFSRIASMLLIAGMASSVFAADDSFSLKGNVQTQLTKSIADDEHNFSSGWIRANVGGQYKSENLDGLIMLRIFAPEFGNKIEGKNYDKILADLYWANYKWNLGDKDKLNLKVGRWKTDWSQSTHFGTYLDKDLTKRGLWMRDYSHNAIELGWIHGLSTLNIMFATQDAYANKGYVRIEEDMKFTFPLEVKVGYRANHGDPIQYTAYTTHRVATYASYNIIPAFRVYGEYACIYTQDEDLSATAPNYLAPESNYFKPGIYFQPFYLGMDFAPKSGILNTLMSNLMVEWEYINKRDNLYPIAEHTYDDWAWTVAYVKKIASSKLQFSVYSENELSDVGLAFRLTTTFK